MCTEWISEDRSRAQGPIWCRLTDADPRGTVLANGNRKEKEERATTCDTAQGLLPGCTARLLAARSFPGLWRVVEERGAMDHDF